MADSSDDDGDKAGYGRPPRKHRFKKGQSGNPRGRPKRQALPVRTVRQILTDSVEVVINGKRAKLPYHEALLQRSMQLALSGNIAANVIMARHMRDAGLTMAPDERQREQETKMGRARETLMEKLEKLAAQHKTNTDDDDDDEKS